MVESHKLAYRSFAESLFAPNKKARSILDIVINTQAR
jgi:hypothetical protein